MSSNQAEEFKIIEIDEATITLRVDGIMQVNYKKGTTITVELQFRMLEIFNQLCGKTKRPFLFSAMDYVSITKDAQKNAIKTEDIYPGSASAIVADNLAYKLIANFYLKVNKPRTPYKVFSDEESAVEWLLTFCEKN